MRDLVEAEQRLSFAGAEKNLRGCCRNAPELYLRERVDLDWTLCEWVRRDVEDRCKY